MQTVLIVIHMLVAVGLVTLVLLQQGKGADMGAAFGSGASSTVFGARGSASFLSRSTAVLATLFFITSLGLAYFAGQTSGPRSVIDSTPVTQQKTPADDVPVAPTPSNESPAAQVPAVPETK